MNTVRSPLSWYVDKIRNNEPFSSLLYGDGEFIAMRPESVGRTLAYGEVVTEQLRSELVASLTEPGNDIIRATDLHLVEPWTYGGRDIASVNEIAQRAKPFVDQVETWHDGTVWDTEVREGRLGPLIKTLRGRQDVVLVGCEDLCNCHDLMEVLDTSDEVVVPNRNAAGYIDEIEERCIPGSGDEVFLICMGLGAIPLIVRVRRRLPRATFIDLGSVLDVFAKIGAERGWRRELYADVAAWEKLVRKNLEG